VGILLLCTTTMELSAATLAEPSSDAASYRPTHAARRTNVKSTKSPEPTVRVADTISAFLSA